MQNKTVTGFPKTTIRSNWELQELCCPLVDTKNNAEIFMRGQINKYFFSLI